MFAQYNLQLKNVGDKLQTYLFISDVQGADVLIFQITSTYFSYFTTYLTFS